MIEFEAFPKIPRLKRDVVITEKIDGTNAAVIITDDGEVVAGDAAPGFMRPEGVVVYHAASRSLFKVMCVNDETPKGEVA